MKIKKIKIRISTSLSAIMLLFCVVACDALVDETALSEIDPANFFRNNADALGSVIGTYDAMQATFRDKHYLWGEFRADNYINGNDGANANNVELTQNNLTSGNTPALRWDDFYDMINRANEGIANIPNIDGFDPSLLAEAQALRAFAYFQAVRVWGGVPLFTEPTRSPANVERPRTDPQTIFNEVIIPDMLAAEENMSIGNLSNPFRFSLTSIWALQAEVYGFLGDDVNAREALLNIVESGEFSLTTTARDWQNLFLNDNVDPLDPLSISMGPLKVQTGPELIMSIRYSLDETQGQGNRNRSGIFSLFFAGIPSFNLSPLLENKWRERFPVDSLGWVTRYPDTDPVIIDPTTGEFAYGDFRYYLSREGFINLESQGLGDARLAKYNKANYGVALDDSDIVLYRYANIILYLAEVENRLGNGPGALEILNEFRTARQLPLVTMEEFGATQDERELYILDERQFELVGEGQRWWDLRRTNRAIEVLAPILDTLSQGPQLTQERLLFPIFDEHLLENSMLEQTPGY